MFTQTAKATQIRPFHRKKKDLLLSVPLPGVELNVDRFQSVAFYQTCVRIQQQQKTDCKSKRLKMIIMK